MGISFGGISSGLPVNDIISQLLAIEAQPIQKLRERVTDLRTQDIVFNNIENKTKSLQASLKALTARSILDEDLFDAKKATSSNDEVLGVNATRTAAPQSLQVEVKSLATATRASSLAGVGQLASGTTALANIAGSAFTSGDFSVYVNGVAHTVTVDAETDTLDDVLGRITALSPAITGASMQPDGTLQVSTSGAGVVRFGSSKDSSNFLTRTRLSTATDSNGVLSTTLPLSTINLEADVSTAAANFNTAVTAGSKFKLGTVEFDTTGKSLNTLIQEINATPEAGVTASFNLTNNTLSLVSRGSGAVAIAMEDTSGNFLQTMGLLGAGNNSLASQTLGTNAEVVVNNTTLFSTSNSLGEDVTGITGLTLDLKKSNPGSTLTVTVGQDSEKLSTAITDFVAKLNDVLNTIATDTNAETGRLGINSSLTGFRSQLRGTASSAVNGLTTYNSLALIGISTGAANTSAGGGTPATFQFDKAKFEEALKARPTEVKNLMVGTGGILTQMQNLVDNALSNGGDTQKGLFAAADESFQARIRQLNESIDRANQRLSRREEILRRQFQASESLISQYQAQGTAVASLANNLALLNAGG